MAIVIDRAKGFEAMSIYIPLLAVDRVHVTLQSAAARKTMWFYVTGLHWAPEISIKGLFTKLCHLQKTATGPKVVYCRVWVVALHAFHVLKKTEHEKKVLTETHGLLEYKYKVGTCWACFWGDLFCFLVANFS